MTPKKSPENKIRKSRKRPAEPIAVSTIPGEIPPAIPSVQNRTPAENLTGLSGVSRWDIKAFLVLVGFLLIGYYLGTQSESLTRFITNPGILFTSQGTDTISVRKLKNELSDKKFTLINVHTPYEGEIRNTDTFIAYDDIVGNSGSLPNDKNAPIILYCKSGRMSLEALMTVRKLGYTNVRHLSGGMDAWQKDGGDLLDLSGIEEEVLPANGFELPITWGNLGPQLTTLGVIDLAKFKAAVSPTDEQLAILEGKSDQKIRIDATNGQFVVDMLWALGLAQRSIVYEEGPMGQEYKKDAGNFAATGGWSLARDNPMQYLNRFDLIPLTAEQHKKVGKIAQNVYRPCCGNSTWFPDCNHGMAALAAIELMVAAGIPEKEIYKNILALNSFWFPDNYIYTATYFARQGIAWKNIDAKLALSETYSSSKGSGEVAKKVGTLPFRIEQGGGGCGA